MSEELKALECVVKELAKVQEGFKKKAEKDRTKVKECFIMIRGEKCYTEREINDWIEADYLTAAQANHYIDMLEKKQAAAGQVDSKTLNERVVEMLEGTLNNYRYEIQDIKYKAEQEEKKQERWKIAQAQGCTYAEWLNQEEVSRQSEEYEAINGKGRR